jgi:hypothetical protein
VNVWPLVVALMMIAASAEYAWYSFAHAPSHAADVDVTGLVAYCSDVAATLEASPTARQTAAGTITLTSPRATPGYDNFASGPAGSPPYTVQCWLKQPLPPGSGSAIPAQGNPAVGNADATSTYWVSAYSGIAPQALPHPLSASQAGTVVVLTGY